MTRAALIQKAWDYRYAARIEALEDRPISSIIMWGLYRRTWAAAMAIHKHR